MVSTEVLISPPSMSEGGEDETAAKAVVARFWNDMMRRYGNEERYQKDLTSRFKSAEAPEIIIVVDKLLTGFDAPRNAVLYLTRSLKDHKLLQAIARVNRVSEGKDVGLIVDYYGILDHLDEAIDQYMGEATGELMAHLYDVLRPLDLAAGELPQRGALAFEGGGAKQDEERRRAVDEHGIHRGGRLEPQIDQGLEDRNAEEREEGEDAAAEGLSPDELFEQFKSAFDAEEFDVSAAADGGDAGASGMDAGLDAGPQIDQGEAA